MLLPASTGSGESDFVSARLAERKSTRLKATHVTEAYAANTPKNVLAVLEMLVVREESTFTTRVTDLLAPLVIVVRFHPTTPAVRVLPLVAETFFFHDAVASESYTLSLHDALPILTVSV